ncbi:cation diffusion facilitator family transporter [Algoriphagus sp.]|uniref:cation diffusion facilitator family transporter n=1 Tax=Algoriphagus sp. TaxID=1872435 RepID=UPI003918DB04
MAHNHSHDHSSKNLKTAFFLNLGFTIFELIGGYYVNSVAIISDAIHDLGDSLSLGTSWYLDVKSKQSPTKVFSFGYRRFSLLGALINSIVLIAGSIYVIKEAIGRILNPESSDATGMLIFAIIGVVVNGYAAWKLSKGKTLNERVISWHLLEDVLGWVAILIVSIVLHFKDIQYLDPALSLLITVYILWNVVSRLKETLVIFLQGEPTDVDRAVIEGELLKIKNVESIHHTHIWSLDGEHHVFTTHLKLGPIQDLNEMLSIKNQVKGIMKKYPFEHYTIETEIDAERCGLEEDSGEHH